MQIAWHKNIFLESACQALFLQNLFKTFYVFDMFSSAMSHIELATCASISSFNETLSTVYKQL